MIQKMMLSAALFSFICIFGLPQSHAQSQPDYGWYTEGEDNLPGERVRITVTNPLDIPLEDQPIVVERTQLPKQNIPVRWINVVDPQLTPRSAPTVEELEDAGGYLYRRETNGRTIMQQVDDIDKDGVWDEIFFMTDLEPNESRDFFIYIDFYERGQQPHSVHASLANAGRQTMPYWESEKMAWKLWYPHDVDLHGKIEPMLTTFSSYSTASSGYYMPWEKGTDIMQVRESFGAGGMCVFEDPDDPENPARAYHSPQKDQGPYYDTRYAFDVVVNGPMRSMIRVTTTQWDSGEGFYEVEQKYSAIAEKNWSKVEVNFSTFMPPNEEAMFGAGIRRVGTETSEEEYDSVVGDGYVISMGQDVEARIPDEDIGDEALLVPWQATALLVKEEYEPEYVAIDNYLGNHLFKIPVTSDLSYEYMIAGSWSYAAEAANNEEDFIKYIEREALKYNNPPAIQVHELEVKGE